MSLDRTISPQFGAIDHIKLVEPVRVDLPNGCTLFYFNSGGQDLVRIEWIFNNLPFDSAKPILNHVTNAMIVEGTNSLDASQIADKIDYYGAFLHADYGFDHSQVTMHSLSKHLGEVLSVIKDILTDAIYPELEVQTFVRNQQQKLQVSLKKNDVLARRAFNKAVYGNNTYGHSTEIAELQQLQREDILAHYREMYQPQNCTIFAAGKIDENTLALLTETFGTNWENKGAPQLAEPQITPSSEHFIYIDKPGALQSAIRMGLQTINRTHEDFPALQVLNTVLGGYFSSRLMDNIREDKGYTYGIGSGVSSLKYAGALFIATEVGADVTADALKEIEKEIILLKTELIPDDELALVKNYMLGSLLGSLENIFSHADKFKNVYFSGLDYSYYERYTDVVKSVTSEQLLELANKYLDLDKMYRVVVGKM
ncbi:M16 family metallopeptidase [Mucilaginibacter ginkgonis]|uniref:Insulinase family protein n=1 Tax=Mucilaginibacter ginkgonis TaxID=2682091 RepID=A0A6I4HX66_9SPHI|nr:pitrilysin family protein [Mucilaginibacter ginkgonis]QQL51359.1 insulinase family protein [Mucilaginibacter ginkgonis]